MLTHPDEAGVCKHGTRRDADAPWLKWRRNDRRDADAPRSRRGWCV